MTGGQGRIFFQVFVVICILVIICILTTGASRASRPASSPT